MLVYGVPAEAWLFAVCDDLLFLLFAEEIGAPVDQIEQGEHQRERYPGDDVDALRAGAFSDGCEVSGSLVFKYNIGIFFFLDFLVECHCFSKAGNWFWAGSIQTEGYFPSFKSKLACRFVKHNKLMLGKVYFSFILVFITEIIILHQNKNW